MFGSELIEVIIGVVGLYILLSIVCSAIREIVEVFQKAKSYYLHQMIYDLLDGKNQTELVNQFYDHPEINCLFFGSIKCDEIQTISQSRWYCGGKLPSYIPPRSFANAILDMVVRGAKSDEKNISPSSPPLNLLNARNNVMHLSSIRLRRAVLIAIDLADGKYENAVSNLEKWFDTATQRLSEQYKRLTAKIVFCIAFVITVSLNINTVTIIDYIYRQNTTTHLAASVENFSDGLSTADTRLKDYTVPRVPIGWNGSWSIATFKMMPLEEINWLGVANSLFGILLTAFAASLGAPFWFDLLAKIVELRTSIPPKKTQNKIEEPALPQIQVPVQLGTGFVSAPSNDAVSDDENEEGFDGVIVKITQDENLPPSMGGVK